MLNKSHSTLVFVFLILFFSGPIRAGSIADISIGLGSYSPSIGRYQTDVTGTKNGLTFNPYFDTEIRFQFWDHFSITPQLGLGIPQKGRHEKITRWHYFFLGHADFHWEGLHFRLGVGMGFQQVSAEGGTEDLRNGTGVTSFPLPNGVSTARNVIVSTGVQYVLLETVSLKIGASAYNLTESVARSYTILWAFSYHFGKVWEW